MAGCSSSDGSDASAPPTTTGAPAATSTTSAAPAASAYDGDDFYAVPDPLPSGPHGTLIRYEPLEDQAFDDATAYRIMYLSESVQGEPIAVTGLASVPTTDAPADGRPTVTIAHGTTGIADECAPSVDGTNGELSLVANAASDEYLIAATDYEGLGTPGRHPYLVGESEGRSTIDAALAAGELPDADPGTKLGIAGYSQGGHGALWASQVAAEWAPDLEVVGTFSGAPASEIGVILNAAPQVKGFGLMVIAGIHAAYPDADLSEILTPEGIELLDAVDEGCIGQVFAAANGAGDVDLFVPGSGQSEEWAELGAEQDAGTEKTNDAPTLLIHSNTDETVPTFFIDQVEQRMCANGQVVDRVDLPSGGHGTAAIPAYEQAMVWMADRFDPDAPPSPDTCS